MGYNVKEVAANRPSRLTSGHRMCAGCGAPTVARTVLKAVKPEDHVVIANATGLNHSSLSYGVIQAMVMVGGLLGAYHIAIMLQQ